MKYANFGTLLCGLLSYVGLFSSPLLSQTEISIVPERRVVISQNTDFPGSDLSKLLDATYKDCQAACLATKECRAFTYNTKVSACFLKSGVNSSTPFEGAESAEIVSASGDFLAFARRQAGLLEFLPQKLLTDAFEMARDNGWRFPTNQWSHADLTKLAKEKEKAGQFERAIQLHRAALNEQDTANGWTEVARLSLVLAGQDRSKRYTFRQLATSAALNAFLRSGQNTTSATALHDLGDALEATGQGRLSIPTLRLSQKMSPRQETEDKLDRAIRLFGFRIQDHQVDNNAADPQICVNFSEDLATSGVDYSSYVQIAQAGTAVDTKDRQLCISGVRHGQRVAFKLREGLPSSSGEKLYKSVDMNVYVRDRAPHAYFPGRAYVLPKSASASLPLVSVNLQKIALKIYQIGDRNLLRSIQDERFQNPLSLWQTNDLKQELGQEIWSGSGDVMMELNKEVTTALPIGEAISSFEPGVYAMTASTQAADQDGNLATQWFIVTDIGLSTLTGVDGLHVFARSLGSADALKGVNIRLLAKNNDILGEAVTDVAGHAHFDATLVSGKGGRKPALVTAGDISGDFAFLQQDTASYDLSDRGVKGRPPAPPIDVFVATDRDAYRPGEQIYTTILARDGQANALTGLAVSAVLLRPDGVEHARVHLKDAGAGGHLHAFSLPDGAQRGRWKIKTYVDPKAPPLSETVLLVEDFVPERIDFNMAFSDPNIAANAVAVLEIDARYLYGAPAADLAIEGDVRLFPNRRLPDYPGYVFGLADESLTPRLDSLPTEFVTDQNGHVGITVNVPATSQTTLPTKMEVSVRLRDGSARPLERRISTSIAPDHTLVGIKPLFGETLAENATAGFEIIALGKGATQVGLQGVNWTLNRLETTYQWYESYGRWEYEPATRREKISGGVVDLEVEQPVSIQAPVAWGQYELKLTSHSGEYTAASYQFEAGWYAPADSTSTPDKLEIGTNAERYNRGDTVDLRVVSRWAGKARVAVVSNKIIDLKEIDVIKGENKISLEITDDWGVGAYVTATVIRPLNVTAKQNPARALGLKWVAVEPGEKQLMVRFSSADQGRPSAPFPVRLKVAGAIPGEPVFATIAAVDLGVLNITGFMSPHPSEHYFGQRKLGMEIRDLYGRLIDGLQGNPGALRSGGDSARNRLTSPPPTEELLAFSSGIITANEAGEIETSFDIPDFNGTMRLMAVVWSQSGVGQAEQDVTLRHPVVVSVTSPRFMAPDDSSRLLIEIAHATGPTGEFQLSVSSDPGLSLATTPVLEKISLLEKQHKTISVPFTAGQTSDPRVQITLTTPDGTALKKTVTIPVRSYDPEISRQTRVELAAGKTLTLDSNMFAGLRPGSARAHIAMGPLARFNAPALLDALNRYPYGCTEQITSKAMPLLYFDQVANALNIGDTKQVQSRIDQAIAGVLSNQSSSGSFGLWRPSSGDLWLDSYVSDFLSRARALGYRIPETAFRQSMDNLRNRVNYAGDFDWGGEDIAYALMVMAREGAANIGDLRYYADARAENFATPLALAQLGTALVSYGDQARADTLFRLAVTRLNSKPESPDWRSDYGTHFRDVAAVLTLAAESGSQAVNFEDLAKTITQEPQENRSTQENLWSLLAARALIESKANPSFLMNGQPFAGPPLAIIEEAMIANETIEVTNSGKKQATTTLTVFGVPTVPQSAGGTGYKIERNYFSPEGEEVDIAKIAQNTRLVVVLTITPLRSDQARLMINDPLPAGFEIENPSLMTSSDARALEWLSLKGEAEYSEFRTERFLAAVDWQGRAPLRLAYRVRAISPGRFHHPAASVEDMYRPGFRAISATGRVQVTAR